MRIRMLTGMAGPGLLLNPGQEIDRHPNEAQRLIQSGAAEPVLPKREGKKWKLSISPQEYRERFPTGPNIGLALELLGETK